MESSLFHSNTIFTMHNLFFGTSFTMLILILVPFVSSISTHASAFPTCPKCGHLAVPYPLSTTENCGNSKYKVHCNNGNLEFSSADGFHYKILSINPSSSRLIIGPPGFVETNTCQSPDLSFGGLNIDENSPFNISSRNTVMLFNCSENILLSPLNCSVTSPCRLFEKSIEQNGCQNTLCCSYLKDSSMTSHRIRIRVGGCSGYTSVVNFKSGDPFDAWNFGIELQWLPPGF